jgi:hypothetical protein
MCLSVHLFLDFPSLRNKMNSAQTYISVFRTTDACTYELFKCSFELSNICKTCHSHFLFTKGATFDTLNAEYTSLYVNQHVKDVTLLRVPANPRLWLTERDCMLGFTLGVEEKGVALVGRRGCGKERGSAVG